MSRCVWASLFCALSGISCSFLERNPAPVVYSDFLSPAAKNVRERGTLSNPATASIGQLALSLPVFEVNDIETVFKQEGVVNPIVNTTGESWFLGGDGAQRPVMVERLSTFGESPVKLKVVIAYSDDWQSATLYELLKVDGGWKVLRAKEGRSRDLTNWPLIWE